MLMCQLALMGQARIGADPDYNPNNPDDPQSPITKYTLVTEVTSQHGGTTNHSSAQRYAEGTSIYLRAYTNTGYRFVNWLQGDSVVSTSSSFYYTMPAKNVTLTAVFKYNPDSPADPDSLGIYYTLTVEAQPKQGGSFNVSNTEVMEEHTTSLYAYTNIGYRFKGWKMGDSILSTENRYSYTMGNKDAHIIGMFEYNPSNPENPGKNSWDEATGEVIVDDFTPGNLSNAIYNALNKSNSSSDDVTMITVAGQMSSNDFGIANNYYNCTLLDLSRTYGYSDIPSYAYDWNSNLQHIILPVCVENIGYCAFNQCYNLSEVTCYAVVPPTVEDYAFSGIAEGAVLHVLSSSISLYAEAEGWKDFTILPLTEEVRTLEVNLPAGSEDGRYKNMTLELVNAETGHKQKYVISNRVNYTFSGLLKKSLFNVYLRNSMGFVLGQIENIAIAEEDVSVTFEAVMQPQDVALSVLTTEGDDVTNQIQATWFDAAGTYLTRGNAIKGVTEGTALTVRVALPQTLAMAYIAPKDTIYMVQASDNKLNIVLSPLPQVTISGTVKDVTTGSAISNAVVSVSQTLNGKYSKAFTAKTNNKGAYSMTVYDAPSAITYSSSDYISQTVNYEVFSTSSQLGEVALKSITGATITTSFTYRTSVEEGATPDIQNWYSDYANVAYSIYNKTQQKPINDFSVQYPSIVLLEEVAEGDELVLTATSKNGAFVPVEATTVIDASNRAEAIFDIVALGGIKASFTSTDNSAVVGILYNAGGQLVKKYNYSSATININDLQDGKYTLVSMGSSTLFNSIYNLSQLASTGLKEGTDYVKNTVTVESGLIASINNDLIPTLDESKLYYTGDNTMFSVNKTSVTAGNYLTLKGKIEFKNVYASKVSNVNMVIDLPESTEFVENSVMVGTGIASYTLDGNRLTIPLERYTDQVRFCIIPTTGGDYAPNAFAQFTIDGKEVLQPIGSAHYTIKDLSISVPSTVAKTTIPVSGTALGNSTIQIYDNDVLIGETTSLANGVWSTTCELDEPYNLSNHKIYAKVTNKQGLELHSETRECMYDMNAIQVNKVTMYYNGYVNEFDFQNPSNKPQSYTYSSNTAFTFTIDFNNNDTTKVSNVILYVKTMANTWVPLSTMYDKKKGLWVASTTHTELKSYPVNVSVEYDYNKDFIVDRELLDLNFETVNRLVSESTEKRNSIYKDYYAVVDIDSLFIKIDQYLTDNSIDSTSDELKILLSNVHIISDSFIPEDISLNELETRVLSLEKEYDSLVNKVGVEEFVELVDNGYLSYSLTDGGIIYFKIDYSVFDIIDVSKNKRYKMEILDNVKQLTRGRINEDFMGYVNCGQQLVSIINNLMSISEKMGDDRTQWMAIIRSLSESLQIIQCYYQGFRDAVEHNFTQSCNKLAAQYDELLKDSQNNLDNLVSKLSKQEDEFKALSLRQHQLIDKRMEIEENPNLTLEQKKNQLISLEDELDDIVNRKSELYDEKVHTNSLIKKAKSAQTNLEKNRKLINSMVDDFMKIFDKIPPQLSKGITMPKWLRVSGKLAGEFGIMIQVASLYLDVVEMIDEEYEWLDLADAIDKKIPCEGNPSKAENLKDRIYDDVIGNFRNNLYLISGEVSAIGFSAAGGVPVVSPTWWAESLISIACEWGKKFNIEASLDLRGQYWVEITQLNCSKDCGKPGMPPCPEPNPGGGAGSGGGTGSGNADIEPNIDPSGYVYEGVSSNRVEGVMASCYYKETVEDMYGDLHENIVLWDAEQYAQENPLFTDENGMYRWDVPQGLWQVKFEKEGYETTYSDWLPVPPPQLEVNIGIKQSTQPEVKTARAYEDGIEVEFSKYMQPDLLNTENIFVTKNGEIATGSVKLLNEEQSYAGKAETYASKVRFVPETAFLTTDEVVLTVSRKVKSYAGVPMQEDYTQEFDIEKEVKSLVADSVIKVPYGGSRQMTINALPYDAAIGKRLVVKSSSSMIATVDADTLVMDENGQATVTLTGELPGTSVVTYSLLDADITGMSTVQVAILEDMVTANPTASRVSGTAVYRGAEVALSCETEGAVIYYTLDGSCPCDEAAQIEYKEPIVITEDSVVIKAMAVAEDMYESDVVEFRYTLKKTTLGLSLNEGWNWVSHNVETPVAATELEKNAVRIVSQTEELVKDPTYGLIGNLDSISPVEAYKVQVSENTEYTLTGYEYNAATPISISAGWNWLGYPVNQVMSVDEAFANATPTEGDCIVGQNGFALYSDGVWTGTLLTLNPCIGYMYQAKVGYEFAYNTSIVSKAKALYGKGIANGTPWTADKYKYPKVMCVVADLFVDGEVANEYSVGAFCGTECRGVGKYVDGKLMISVYGSGNEKIAFVAMDNETGKTFSVTEEVVFAETLLGSIKQAYPLHIGETTSVLSIFGGWNVRIEGDNLYLTADDKAFDRVTLTDVYGNVVCVAENLSQGEAINVATLSDGVYIVAAEQDGIMYYKKIMKAGK